MSGNGVHFEFETTGFADDIEERNERPNEDIGSMSLARWLAAALRARGFEASEPWCEDHGCDFSIVEGGATYLCVCFSDDEDLSSQPTSPRRAGVTLRQTRGLMDRLLGRNKAPENGALGAAVYELLGAHADVAQLERVS